MEPEAPVTEEGDQSLDSKAFIRAAFRRSLTKLVELLQPDVVLDLFEERNQFGDHTRIVVRDIREETTTSGKNRALYEKVMRDHRKYVVLKECLARSRQLDLLDILESAEAEVHDEMTENGQQKCCSATGSCSLLASLHCARDIPRYMPSKIKDIQRSLIQLYEDKCQTAPVFALIPEVTESIERLYVKPNMQSVDIRGKDLGLNSQSCRKTSQKELKVNSYRDIFYKDNKPCRNIYITGDAGIGKSAFCESLVHTWCKANARSRDCKTHPLSDNEQLMSEFPLLYYVSLRYALDDSDIEHMIANQLGVDSAKELLKTQKCLVVLDGLDEWTSHKDEACSRFTSQGLPKRSLKGNSVVLTTSRPWKLEKLRLKENEIDKQINITELTKLSVEELSDRILSVMNEAHNTKKQTYEFIKFMKESQMNDHLKTPVLLSLMVCLWYYDVPCGNSECEIYSNIIDKQIEIAEELKGLHIQDILKDESGTIVECHSIPSCFQNSPNCKRYSSVLLSLSKLAFNILFHEDRESSLVFDHKDTEIFGMSPSTMGVCLKIGLLTQNKVFVNFVKKSKSISFIHKTHQEFFAALYIATLDYDTAYSLLTSKGKRSLDTFLEMSKVLLFLNGMNIKLGDNILNHVRELAQEDRRVLDYRLSCIGPCDKNFPLVRRVQYLIIDCEIERQKNRLPPSTQQIDDMVATDVPSVIHLTKHWEVLKPRQASSVSVQTLTRVVNKQRFPELWNMVFRCARESKRLQKIYIFDCIMCLDLEIIYKTVIDTRSSLTCLVLCSIDLSGFETTKLRDILTLPRLLTLGLGDHVDLTHKQLEIVSDFLLGANYIQELRLKKITCLTHSKQHETCKIMLDISRNNALCKLFVAGQIDKILIDPSNVTLLEARFLDVPGVTKELLECLKGSTKLTEVELTSKFQVDKNAMIDIIPELEAVRQIRLLSMDFTGMPLRFPKSMKQLEFVMLREIMIDNASLRNLLDDLPTQKVEIWMGRVTMSQDLKGEESVKDYIRRSDKFEVTLDDPTWMYFHTVC